MNSFQSIVIQKHEPCGCGPGIAEALFATALGLAAAIPAVIACNTFAGDLERFSARLETFARGIGTLLARQLDEVANNGRWDKTINRRERHRPMGGINVIPFVDVMLVLLIVFMVTAPLLTVGVGVDLPKTKAGAINADAALGGFNQV